MKLDLKIDLLKSIFKWVNLKIWIVLTSNFCYISIKRSSSLYWVIQLIYNIKIYIIAFSTLAFHIFRPENQLALIFLGNQYIKIFPKLLKDRMVNK